MSKKTIDMEGLDLRLPPGANMFETPEEKVKRTLAQISEIAQRRKARAEGKKLVPPGSEKAMEAARARIDAKRAKKRRKKT